jgi:hypothetical protein
MRVDVALDLPGLEKTLAQFLPAGTKPTLVRLTSESLRVEGKGPLGVAVAVTANVHAAPGALTLSQFGFEGPRMLHGVVLDALRRKVAECNVRAAGLRVRGDETGERLVVSW